VEINLASIKDDSFVRETRQRVVRLS